MLFFNRFTIGFLSLGSLLSAQPSNPPADALPSAVDLFEESYALGASLTPANRCRLLDELARRALPIAPSLANSWSKELFQNSFGLTKSPDRGAYQKNAIESLAKIDVTTAFGLIAQMDEPVPSNGVVPEDLRAFVAAEVYPPFWRNKPSEARLGAVQSQARALAANGQYPYLGALPILTDVLEKDQDRGLGWWSEILSWYVKGSAMRDSDQVFVRFFKEAYKVLPVPTRSLALRTIVKRVLYDKSGYLSGPGTAVYRATVVSTNGTFIITSPGQVLAVKLLPEIRESAPELLDDLSDKSPMFLGAKDADYRVKSISQATVYNSDSGSNAAAANAIFAEQSVLEKVGDLVQTDPASALRLASSMSRLREDALRAVGVAGEELQPALLAKLGDEASTQLETTSDKPLKLELLVIRARSMQETSQVEAKAALHAGFELGEDLFEEFVQSHPVTAIDEVPSLQPLQKLTRIGMRIDSWNTLAYLRRIGDIPLRAWLLIEAGTSLDTNQEHRGVQEKRSTAR